MALFQCTLNMQQQYCSIVSLHLLADTPRLIKFLLWMQLFRQKTAFVGLSSIVYGCNTIILVGKSLPTA